MGKTWRRHWRIRRKSKASNSILSKSKRWRQAAATAASASTTAAVRVAKSGANYVGPLQSFLLPNEHGGWQRLLHRRPQRQTRLATERPYRIVHRTCSEQPVPRLFSHQLAGQDVQGLGHSVWHAQFRHRTRFQVGSIYAATACP